MQSAHELLDEERVAGGRPLDEGDEPVGAGPPRMSAASAPMLRLRAGRAQSNLLAPLRPWLSISVSASGLPARTGRDRQIRGQPQSSRSQVEGRRIGPVRILEHQDERLFGGECKSHDVNEVEAAPERFGLEGRDLVVAGGGSPSSRAKNGTVSR